MWFNLTSLSAIFILILFTLPCAGHFVNFQRFYLIRFVDKPLYELDLIVNQWYIEHYMRFHQEIAISTNARKRLSTFKKEEIRNSSSSSKNYQETTRAFKLQDSTIRNICKVVPPKISKPEGFKGRKTWK